MKSNFWLIRGWFCCRVEAAFHGIWEIRIVKLSVIDWQSGVPDMSTHLCLVHMGHSANVCGRLCRIWHCYQLVMTQYCTIVGPLHFLGKAYILNMASVRSSLKLLMTWFLALWDGCNCLVNTRCQMRTLFQRSRISQAGITNYIPQFTVGCNYLSLPEISASVHKVHIHASHWIN